MRTVLSALLLAVASQGMAQDAEKEAHCKQLYETIKAQTSADPDSCIPTLDPTREFEQCTKPHSYAGERQASHIMLILDASGSMAGTVSGKSKMELAKQESAKFLKDLAKDLPVGLMVYGHKGNNKDSGKAESCAGVETLLPIGETRKNVSKLIGELRPTGWTPLAGALALAERELGNPELVKEGQQSAPVVYLVSDGEETCNGDPVAAARSLHTSGVQATVNVIGFDVDQETRNQLEEISAAGGGKFFPAKDAKALRDHLNAAKDAELSFYHFESCIARNQSIAVRPYRKALLGMPACMNRQSQKNFGSIISKEVRGLTDPKDKRCVLSIYRWLNDDTKAITEPLISRYDALVQEQSEALNAARATSIQDALPPKK